MRRIERVGEGDALLFRRTVVDADELFLHRVDGGKHVGAIGAENVDAERGVAVLVGKTLALAAADMDIGNVAEMYGFAGAPLENEVLEIRDGIGFARIELLQTGRDGIAAAVFEAVAPAPNIDRSAGYVFRTGDLLRHFRNLNAELGGADRIEHDIELFDIAVGDDARAADTRHRLDARDDDVLEEGFVVADLARIARKLLHEDVEQRRVGILAARQLHDRLLGVGRERRQAVEAADHVDQRRLHVGTKREGQGDIAAAAVGIPVHFLQTRQSLQHVLFRLDELGFDLAWRFRAPVGLDADLRPVDIGEELDGETIKRKSAEQDCNRNADRDCGRTLQGRRCETAHVSLSLRYDERLVPAIPI